jgi:hypothetical protein
MYKTILSYPSEQKLKRKRKQSIKNKILIQPSCRILLNNSPPQTQNAQLLLCPLWYRISLGHIQFLLAHKLVVGNIQCPWDIIYNLLFLRFKLLNDSASDVGVDAVFCVGEAIEECGRIRIRNAVKRNMNST